MSVARALLRCSVVGIAIIFSAGLGAAGLSCQASQDAYRCEAWPQGDEYRYEWHLSGNVVSKRNDIKTAHERTLCSRGNAVAIAISVIAPTGHIETATGWLPVCPETAAHEATDRARSASL
ncbi:MAG: hypothetical protein JNN30_00315 [Rhodanobacteraceae bacterium]|nr:hypothetical protein [Rhodanobacteraceae bacterium]